MEAFESWAKKFRFEEAENKKEPNFRVWDWTAEKVW